MRKQLTISWLLPCWSIFLLKAASKVNFAPRINSPEATINRFALKVMTFCNKNYKLVTILIYTKHYSFL